MVLRMECVGTGAPLPFEGAAPQVLFSNAGYYIGFLDEDGQVYTRESRYYRSPELAQDALDAGTFGRHRASRVRSLPRKGGRVLRAKPVESPVVKRTDLSELTEEWVSLPHTADRWTVEELQQIQVWRSFEPGPSWLEIAAAIDRMMLSQDTRRFAGQGVSNAYRRWMKDGGLAIIKPGTYGSQAEWKAANRG